MTVGSILLIISEGCGRRGLGGAKAAGVRVGWGWYYLVGGTVATVG